MTKFDSLVDRLSPHGVKYDAADLPDVAYHYTDAAGLVGMLSSDSIWATEHRYLNDKSEVLHTRALVRKVVGARLQAQPSAQLTSLYSGILEALDRPEDTQVSVFSLSSLQDDLSQWRGYAQDGRGFTVGFDIDVIARRAAISKAPFGFARVEYDVSRQERVISKALVEVENAFLTADHEALDENVLDQAVESFDRIAWNRGVANKHNSFKSENEWRIFSFAYEASEVKVRPSDRGLVPYMVLTGEDLAGTEKLPIKSIGIGPGFATQDQVPAVNALCRQYGYEPKVYLANAPYRSM